MLKRSSMAPPSPSFRLTFLRDTNPTIFGAVMSLLAEDHGRFDSDLLETACLIAHRIERQEKRALIERVSVFATSAVF